MTSPLTIAQSQAEDDGLWFQAQTASEAYLQQELRRLHAAIEGKEQPRDQNDTSCPNPTCDDPDFADPETQCFVPVESGVQPGTHHGPAVHWAEGWIVCRKCGHTEWTGVSD